MNELQFKQLVISKNFQQNTFSNNMLKKLLIELIFFNLSINKIDFEIYD